LSIPAPAARFFTVAASRASTKGETDAAVAAYESAIALSANENEFAFLRRRLDLLSA